MKQTASADAFLFVGRVLMAAIFIWSGWGKITNFAGTQATMASAGLPGILAPLVILTELGGGLLLILGFQTRIIAFLLAGYTFLAAFFFHTKFGDRNQLIHFYKNIAMIGGFFQIVACGGGRFSLDAWWRKRG